MQDAVLAAMQLLQDTNLLAEKDIACLQCTCKELRKLFALRDDSNASRYPGPRLNAGGGGALAFGGVATGIAQAAAADMFSQLRMGGSSVQMGNGNVAMGDLTLMGLALHAQYGIGQDHHPWGVNLPDDIRYFGTLASAAANKNTIGFSKTEALNFLPDRKTWPFEGKACVEGDDPRGVYMEMVTGVPLAATWGMGEEESIQWIVTNLGEGQLTKAAAGDIYDIIYMLKIGFGAIWEQGAPRLVDTKGQLVATLGGKGTVYSSSFRAKTLTRGLGAVLAGAEPHLKPDDFDRNPALLAAFQGRYNPGPKTQCTIIAGAVCRSPMVNKHNKETLDGEEVSKNPSFEKMTRDVVRDAFSGVQIYGPDHPIVGQKFLGGCSAPTRTNANNHFDSECLGSFRQFRRACSLGTTGTNEEVVSLIATTMITKLRERFISDYVDGARALVHTYRADIIRPAPGVRFHRTVVMADIMNWAYGNGVMSPHPLADGC
jgi:hypothetical protein